jgi:hypothetical protein
MRDIAQDFTEIAARARRLSLPSDLIRTSLSTRRCCAKSKTPELLCRAKNLQILPIFPILLTV